jgi:hypothetical protein
MTAQSSSGCYSDRLKSKENFEIFSWVDHFFVSEMHIIGLGLNFHETDLWWLITYRARWFDKYKKIRSPNRITYHSPKKYKSKNIEKERLLRAAGIMVEYWDYIGPEYYKFIAEKLKK